MTTIDYGLAFHVDMKLVDDVKTHFVKTALVGAELAKPIFASFKYEIPEAVARAPRRLGASETVGIFGGVDDPAQKMLSEVIERNIGDALTLSIMQFLLDRGRALVEGSNRRLLVLGPPIPKVIGRFASLRIPRALKVGWFYCFPPPEWLSSFPGWSIVARSGHHSSRLWMEDDLVIEDYWIDNAVEYRVAWMNQYIDYANVHSEKWLAIISSDLRPTPWVDSSVSLPPVLSLAALYALAERARSYGVYRDSPVEVLAAASLEWAIGEDAQVRFQERAQLVQRIAGTKSNIPKFQEARRGEDPLKLEDLVDLVRLWNEIKSSAPVLPSS
jgi:hypothetical protein